SRALDLTGIAWENIPRHPLPADAVRALRYMQDIEIHTIIYLRQLLSTRAIDDPRVPRFLPSWATERRFTAPPLPRSRGAPGHTRVARGRSKRSLAQWIEDWGTSLVARRWESFVAVHMTWGAINELTALSAYQRLAARAGHPVLSELLSRIMRDESRHF